MDDFLTDAEYKSLTITQEGNWEVKVRVKQHTLGWLILAYIPESEISLMEVSKRDYLQLYDLANIFQPLIQKLFKPQAFNYLQLGAKDPRLHVHMAPRYDKDITFNGYVFTDPNWGERAPLPKEWDELPDAQTVLKIAEVVKEEFANL